MWYRVRLFLSLTIVVTLVLLATYVGYRFFFFRPQPAEVRPPEPRTLVVRELMPEISAFTEATGLKLKALCAGTTYVILMQAYDDPIHPSEDYYAVLAYYIGDGKIKPFGILVTDFENPNNPPTAFFDFDRDGYVDLKGRAGTELIGDDVCDKVDMAR